MGLGKDILWATLLTASSPIWATRMLRSGKWRTDWSARLGHAPQADATAGRPTLLIHAVSVGEVNAIRTLIDELSRDPATQHWRVVISTTTDTGTARAKQLFEPAHEVVRYPLDFTFAVDRFLDAVQPNLVALVELELWPNFTERCAKRGIPLVVINGRLSARSFKRYRLVRGLVKPSFARLAHAAVQTPAYAERFAAMGVASDRVSVTDSMKWDTAQISNEVQGADELARQMGIDRSRPIVVCGSTGPGEEKLLIEACPAEAQLVIVPRKPERFDEVAQLAASYGPLVRRTQQQSGERAIDATQLFLLDTMGELRKAYALADVVLVGRSFLGLYGSDLMEPIALGKATVIGPHYGDFQDAVEAFVAGGGAIVSDEPGKVTGELLADPARAKALGEAGRAVIRSRQGATARHVKLLADIMPAS